MHSYAHNLYIDLCHGHYKTLHTVTLDLLKINKAASFCNLQLNTFL